MNSVLDDLGKKSSSRLGPNVTADMLKKAQAFGCFLGFLRPDALRWGALRDRLPGVKKKRLQSDQASVISDDVPVCVP